MMDEAIWNKIILELAELKFKGRVHLYSYNEPLLDPLIRHRIRHVREVLPRTSIAVLSNGDLLRGPEDIVSLFEAGLNQFQINVYSKHDGTGDADLIAGGIAEARERHEKFKAWFDEVQRKVDRLHIGGNIFQHCGADYRTVKAVPWYGYQPGDADKSIHLGKKKHEESMRYAIDNRAGAIPWFSKPLAEPLKASCVRPFRSMIINWKGSMIQCCDDYYGAGSPGNVAERSLVELWNDERYHKLRLKLQNKDRRSPLCRQCNYHGGFYRWNVPNITFGSPEADEAILAEDWLSADDIGYGQPSFIPLTVSSKKART
jgi:radical SAM protein with 4Fe4S-binding SPASM domain